MMFFHVNIGMSIPLDFPIFMEDYFCKCVKGLFQSLLRRSEYFRRFVVKSDFVLMGVTLRCFKICVSCLVNVSFIITELIPITIHEAYVRIFSVVSGKFWDGTY